MTVDTAFLELLTRISQEQKNHDFLLESVTYPNNSRYTLCIHNQGMLLDG